MENNKNNKQVKTNPNGFYERITDSKGLDIDGILTEEESNYIFDIFNEIVNPDLNNNDNINFNGKTFCLL